MKFTAALLTGLACTGHGFRRRAQLSPNTPPSIAELQDLNGDDEPMKSLAQLLSVEPATAFRPAALGRQGTKPRAAPSSMSVPNGFAWDAARGLYAPTASGLQMPRMDEPEVEPGRTDPSPSPAPGPARPMPQFPMVGAGDDKVDVMSRLLRDRITLLGQQVDDTVANLLVAQLLYLSNEDDEKDIILYINSPGGSVSAGFAIFDTMQFIPVDTNTVCFGCAASMGAFLLGAGAKGKRRSLPNARIMIHQPLGGAQGQAADIEIQAKEILSIRSLLNQYISDYTGQPVEKVEADCDRDYWMTPPEAKEYGIIDEVLPSKVRIPVVAKPDLIA